MKIVEMQPGDWESVSRIYGEGIATGNATFEQQVPAFKAWSSAHIPGCSLVARKDGAVLGWAALSPVSSRCVYKGVAEVSLYVGEKHRGTGTGSSLMKALIELSESQDIWTLQAGIFPENAASISLHRKFGFREVGVREKLGKMNGRWRDVVLMERRSGRAGID
jgi:L-amino acid N-acyltransferase YncA